ncbi:MAG: ATP-binding protein [Nitrospirae bacterium]|nr:ATP-binding protein [Nitrospirota bacterium]
MPNKNEPIADRKSPSTESVLNVPEEAFAAISEDSEKAGGPWTPPPGYEGSIGRTMFDTPSSKDGTVTVLLPKENIDILPSQALVRVESLADSRTYLGAVTEGPFAEPDGLRADATPMVISTVQGGLLMPKYHGRLQIEIIGERLDGGVIVPPRRRPKPNSPVFPLDASETKEVLRIQGNLRIGLADGFDDLEVRLQADNKNVFPRHLGILGTTGGGKSTTVSGFVAKAREQNMAVILIDTEGEYCAIHEPTKDVKMIQALNRRGLSPEGVENTTIHHLIGKDTANPNHPNRQQFSLRFSELSPYAVQEILQLSDAQSERFLKAYDATKLALERFGVWPTNDEERRQLIDLDEQESGYPRMTLTHLYDVIKETTAIIEKGDAEPYLENAILRDNRSQLRQIIGSVSPPSNVISWRALMGRVNRIKRLRIFDSPDAGALNYETMLQPGRVSIIDLSDTDSPQINNLVIAELLRGVQTQQERAYTNAIAEGRPPTLTTIFIEEAHEFLSAQRISKMQVLFQQVARIARRGRKRWLGLVFITQLPQHLPDEVLGLINNWVLHKISDSSVISRLKNSIGGLNESLWRQVPSLAPGQAVVSFATQARPLLVSIDPTPCRLLMTE